MMIHLIPRFLTCNLSGPDCNLVDLSVDEFGLHLKGGVDLDTRRPYPNKNYRVATRKVGRKAAEGILICAPEHVWKFTAVYRWKSEEYGLHTHRVTYVLQDDTYSATSESMVLWHGYTNLNPDWTPREVVQHTAATPASRQPRMEVTPFLFSGRTGEIEDIFPSGFVEERIETFHLPTLQPERILSNRYWSGRAPKVEHAFFAEGC